MTGRPLRHAARVSLRLQVVELQRLLDEKLGRAHVTIHWHREFLRERGLQAEFEFWLAQQAAGPSTIPADAGPDVQVEAIPVPGPVEVLR